MGNSNDGGIVLEYCPQLGLVRQMERTGVVASKCETSRGIVSRIWRLGSMGEQY